MRDKGSVTDKSLTVCIFDSSNIADDQNRTEASEKSKIESNWRILQFQSLTNEPQTGNKENHFKLQNKEYITSNGKIRWSIMWMPVLSYSKIMPREKNNKNPTEETQNVDRIIHS